MGKSALVIAQSAGIKHKGDIRLIVIPASPDEVPGPLGHEKRAPALSLFVVNSEAEGLAVCQRILGAQGSGHKDGVDRELRCDLVLPGSTLRSVHQEESWTSVKHVPGESASLARWRR